MGIFFKKALTVVICFLLMLSISIESALACTRILLKNDLGVIVGRNMDWYDANNTKYKIITMPKGIARNGGVDTNPLEWKSKYGSLVISIYDIGTVDGMNEKGLSASLLYLPGTDYGKRDASRKGLFATIWTQFFLDNFSSVKEAVKYLKKNNIQIVTLTLPGHAIESGLHISLQDKSGDSAILEYIKGELVIHHGTEYKILTNQPAYTEQLENLKQYKGFGGELEIPGGSTPKDRFVRANHYLSLAMKPKNNDDNLKMMFGFLGNAAQLMIKTLAEESPNTSPTQYSIIFDLTNSKLYMKMTVFNSLVTVDMKKLNFKEGAKQQVFDVQKTDVRTDITDDFDTLETPFNFATETSFRNVKKF